MRDEDILGMVAEFKMKGIKEITIKTLNGPSIGMLDDMKKKFGFYTDYCKSVPDDVEDYVTETRFVRED